MDEIIEAPTARPAIEGNPRRLAETDWFRKLSAALARDPASATQRLVDAAMSLTGAGSAGLSVEESAYGEPVFRWIATAGEFQRYRDETLPGLFSPCGEVLARRRPLVMREPVRVYHYIAKLHVPVQRVLLVPFIRKGRYVGTVWVVAHDAEKVFSTDDLRTVESMAILASALIDSQLPSSPNGGAPPAAR